MLKKIIYSDEFIRLDLKQHDDLMVIARKLKLPLLSKLSEFYANNLRYGILELDEVDNEINKVLDVLTEPESIKLLNNLKSLILLAKKENKPIQVLTD
ncbi:MAG: hypothetical protein Q7K16_02185 [Candidatus Azambacteria bacterium]|nr:hypothetical protein [Candidatus Azambacteria bacterium]